MGYEEEELKPYVEPEPDYKDVKRIGMIVSFFWQKMLHKNVDSAHRQCDLYLGGNSKVKCVCML